MFLLYLLYFSNFVFLFIDYKFSTFIWKFYHVINKSATVYPLAGNMFTAHSAGYKGVVSPSV